MYSYAMTFKSEANTVAKDAYRHFIRTGHKTFVCGQWSTEYSDGLVYVFAKNHLTHGTRCVYVMVKKTWGF